MGMTLLDWSRRRHRCSLNLHTSDNSGMDEKESGPSDLSWKETRERLVQQALDDGDLGRLRELAALPGGFGSNEMRKKVW